MVMNAKTFQHPSDGHADRISTNKAVRMGMTSAGDGHRSMHKKPGKKQHPGVNGSVCRRGDLDSRLSSQGKHQSEMPSSDRKKKENEARSQKKKAEVQRTALRVCGEWSEHVSSSGKAYYYNCRTEVSRWEKPDGWTTDQSDDNASRSKEAKRKQKTQLTRRENSHSAHDSHDSPTTVFPSPTFPSPTFPSPTSQGAFHLRSTQTQYAASTLPDGDIPHRTYPAMMQHQLSGNSFHHAGNFPAKTSSVQGPVQAWRGPAGYCDSPVVDGGGRSRLWSLSSDEPMCLGRSVTSSDGVMYEDMDISPEGSPMHVNDRTAMADNRTVEHFSTSEGRPSLLSLQPGSSSQAGLASSSPNSTLNVTVPDALAVLRDFVRRTADGSTLMESENGSGRTLSDFDLSLDLALDSLSRLDGQSNTLAHLPLVYQAVEMLQKLQTRFVHSQHQRELQQLSTWLLHIQNASQNHSTALPTSPGCSDPRQTATSCTGSIESSLSARRSSTQVETTPPANNHSCDNDFQSLGESTADLSAPAHMPCPSGATSAVPPPLMVLTPSLANYVDNRLIRHVMEWPANVIERQVKSAAEETHMLLDLHWTRLSAEVKNMRSLLRTDEILTTLSEQRMLFLAQQVEDLEKGHAQFLKSYDF